MLNNRGFPQVALQTFVTGSTNYTVQAANIVPDVGTGLYPAPTANDWLNIGDVNLVGATSSAASNFSTKPTHIRITTSAGASSNSSVQLRINEYGSAES